MLCVGQVGSRGRKTGGGRTQVMLRALRSQNAAPVKFSSLGTELQFCPRFCDHCQLLSNDYQPG